MLFYSGPSSIAEASWAEADDDLGILFCSGRTFRREWRDFSVVENKINNIMIRLAYYVSICQIN